MSAETGSEFVQMYLRLIELKIKLLTGWLDKLMDELIKLAASPRTAAPIMMDLNNARLEVINDCRRDLEVIRDMPEISFEEAQKLIMENNAPKLEMSQEDMPPAILAAEDQMLIMRKCIDKGIADNHTMDDMGKLRAVHEKMQYDMKKTDSDLNAIFATAYVEKWTPEKFGELADGLAAGKVPPHIDKDLSPDMRDRISQYELGVAALQNDFRSYIMRYKMVKENVTEQLREHAEREGGDRESGGKMLEGRAYDMLEMKDGEGVIDGGGDKPLELGYTNGKFTLEGFRENVKTERDSKTIGNGGNLGIQDKQKQLSVRDNER